ncbi:MAG TPA: ribonuclease H-like domain-containing protein [Candidatus Scatomonas pullistercoris]|uniref:Ribonuclease H-like domain-containing protein n=1 Tax=Candidatus Scatomonas pullistercoris TaxID=2840920 RepID=A0A9D1P5Q0_9FIRM|nr:ribonuclease H-like domain-containing protein [Candidatus Scatomonas pullistercoris]
MIIRELSSSLPGRPLSAYLDSRKKTVFFDIETTGLSWRSSHLYLIGAAFLRGQQWCLRQWFLEKPQEEVELLRLFSEFLRNFTEAVHYNGQTFDLPYLSHKYEFYRMENLLPTLESLDLYRVVRPWQKILGLPSLKQKDVEQLLCISREDTRSGGELISCYHSYLQTGSQTALQLLLLHNRDDVLGLLQLLPLLGFRNLAENNWTVENAAYKKGELQLSLSLPHPLPVSVTAVSAPYRLWANASSALAAAAAQEGEMKHFFDSYKDYYYLPGEDCAVHKSVGVYVDPAFRRKATARSCYQRAAGIFLPQPEPVFQPVFYRDYGEKPAYLQLREDMLQDGPFLRRYAEAVLRALL